MKKEYLYCSLAIIMWSTIATVTKLLLGHMGSIYVLFYTCFFSSIALFFINLFNGKIKQLKSLSLSIWCRMVSIGSLGVLFYNLFFYLGTSRMPAQQAFVINDLWPVLIIIFSCIFLHEPCTLGKLCAIFTSFGGVIVITMNGHIDFFKYIPLLGVLFCLLDAISYAAFSVLNKCQNYDIELSVFISYIFCTLVTFVYLLISHSFSLPSLENAIGLVYNGLFCNAFPYILWVYALKQGNTAIISNLAYLTPCLSLFITHFVLGEAITIYSIIGLGIIVIGILIQFISQKKEVHN